jgi:purine-binding chemotaxis protein CheW
MNGCKQYSTFLLDGLLLGVDVRQVQEVIRLQEMTRVPLAPPMIRGLINLRGQIVTAIDVRRRFDLPPLPEGRSPMNVVVRCDDSAVSLLVDEIGDVVDIQDEDFEPPPVTLKSPARELITGVYKLKDRLLLVLDTDRAVHPPSAFNPSVSKGELKPAQNPPSVTVN